MAKEGVVVSKSMEGLHNSIKPTRTPLSTGHLPTSAIV